jgi:endonuclease G, mitochondrial
VVKSLFIGIISLIVTAESFGSECNEHTKFGSPSNPDKLLCRSGYAVGYNYKHKSADWVAYKLSRTSVGKNEVSVQHLFAADNDIPEEFRSVPADYRGSGYDRGHLAPPQLMSYSFESMKEAYLLTNIVPQKAGFNRYGYTKYGAWGALENYEHSWALKRGELYVYSGPVYQSSVKTQSGLEVPTHFFKILFDPEYSATIAFLIPHDENTAPQLKAYITSIDCIEEITGFDFFSKIDSKDQHDIENEKAYELAFWSMKDGNSDKRKCDELISVAGN